VRYHRPLIAAAAGAVALLGAFTAAGSAQAAPQPAQRSLYAPSALVLTFGHGEGSSATVQRAVTLRCRPNGGDHPSVGSACAELTAVGGNFATLAGEDGPCTREYNPVTVTASGVWRGRHTTYRGTFSNPCTLLRAKGTVFQF
jgi:hypothetical protein